MQQSINIKNRHSDLVKLNGFSRSSNGVYSAESSADFAYSDGQATELLLKNILSNAQDLSSESAELQARIVDWPTEYHLSNTRANLLRPLELFGESGESGESGVKRVLELGCGCGSITRYLGEQEGIQVDSVEGSPIRAELAAMRCADLSNVSISTANFNEIELPENYYDLVLFVGVTEYAGRFSSRETDQEALQDLLAKAKQASTERGITLIAIENRVGLKYLLGANEDHYAVPYIGLEDYPDSTGIRTYTRSEWQSVIKQAGFAAQRFFYPFPDYKVPTVITSDGADSATIKTVLEHVASRDYNSSFSAGENESRVWQGFAEANTLGEHANSFLILLGQSEDAFDEIANFDVAEYPIPHLDYLSAVTLESRVESEQTTARDTNNFAHKSHQAELSQLQAHADDLQQTIDIMAGSSGWLWLNRLRKLLGKNTVR